MPRRTRPRRGVGRYGRHARRSWHAVPTAVALFANHYVGEPPGVDDAAEVLARTVDAVARAGDRGGAAAVGAVVATGAAAGWLLQSSALATYLVVDGHRAVDRAHTDAENLWFDDGDAHAHAAIVSRTVRALAEHTTDGVVAPALASAVAGAPGALTYRALQHAEVHHGVRRAPDAVTGVLVLVTRPSRVVDVVASVRRRPAADDSIGAAAFAGALGWPGREPEIGDIVLAARLARDLQATLALALFVAGLLDLVADAFAGTLVSAIARAISRRPRGTTSHTSTSHHTSITV